MKQILCSLCKLLWGLPLWPKRGFWSSPWKSKIISILCALVKILHNNTFVASLLVFFARTNFVKKFGQFCFSTVNLTHRARYISQSLGQSREHMILYKKGNSDRPDWSKRGGHHLYLVTEVFVLQSGLMSGPNNCTSSCYKIYSHPSPVQSTEDHIHSNFPLSDLLFLVVGSSIVLFLLLHDSFLAYIVLMLSLEILVPQEQLQLRP